jgi:hypothetical protein
MTLFMTIRGAVRLSLQLAIEISFAFAIVAAVFNVTAGAAQPPALQQQTGSQPDKRKQKKDQNHQYKLH